MNWKLKCLTSHVLASLPQTDLVYDLIQKHLTKRWYRSVSDTISGPNIYTEHINNFHAHYGDISKATYFEFGVARDVFSALLNYCFGIPQQLAVDLRPLARPELINHIIRQLRNYRHPGFVRTTEREIGLDFVADLKLYYGIDYRAPSDARAVEMPDGSVDLIASTSTLEHIPKGDIAEILLECFRLCNNRSVISMQIDYSDHYSHVDKRITPYNFLQFSDKQWKYLNIKHYYTNRLRHSDYRALFQQAGFRIIDESSVTPLDAHKLIASIKLSDHYKDYQVDDLIKTSGFFVAMKQQSL